MSDVRSAHDWARRVAELGMTATDRQARALFARALVFAPDVPIAATLLLTTLHTGHEIIDPNTDANDSLLDDAALIRCAGLGLVEISNDDVLVPADCAATLNADALDPTARPAVVQTLAMLLIRLGEQRHDAVIDRLIPHAEQAVIGTDGIAGVWLGISLADHLVVRGSAGAGLAYGRRALALAEALLGRDHIETAICCWRLSRVVARAGGEHNDVVLLLKRAYAAASSVMGNDHELTQYIQNDLAFVAEGRNLNRMRGGIA